LRPSMGWECGLRCVFATLVALSFAVIVVVLQRLFVVLIGSQSTLTSEEDKPERLYTPVYERRA
jgi:hypothetical protein